jgi:hypothetical protein
VLGDDPDRAADVIGDAIADAVRRAVDEVGRLPLAELGRDDGANGTTGDTGADAPPLLAPDATSEDPYAVLGVARSAPWEQIVAAHKRLARSWHPDAGGDEDLIRRLNAAFAELRIRRGR